MKLYVCMVLGGSICTLLYIFFNNILSYELSLKCKNIFLKINIILYLLPIPWIVVELKGVLKELLEKIGVTFPRLSKGVYLDFNNVWKSVIVRNENNKIIYISGYQKWIPAILTGCIIFFILISGWIISYLVIRHRCVKDITYTDADRYLKNRKRKIKIGISPYIDSPVTIGIIKPIILFPLRNEKYSDVEKGIVQHELNHITNMDGLFRFLTFMIIVTEWYNPLTYYLFRENIAVSEMLCDEVAVRDMTKVEKNAYMQCIITAADKSRSGKTVIMTLGATKSLSRERMERIMGKNGKKLWKKRLAAGIMIFCCLFSSIPALAYKEPLQYKDNLGGTEEEWKRTDIMTSNLEWGVEMDYVSTLDFSQSDYVFINEVGEIYFEKNIDLSNENERRVICSHDFESETVLGHEVDGDGGCAVIKYNIQKCFKCGYINSVTEIARTIFKVCPHK